MRRPEPNLPLQLTPTPKQNEMQTTPFPPQPLRGGKKNVFLHLFVTPSLTQSWQLPSPPLPSSHEEQDTGLELPYTTLFNKAIGANEGWEAAINRQRRDNRVVHHACECFVLSGINQGTPHPFEVNQIVRASSEQDSKAAV